jgi:hypothetical protein
LAPAFDPIDIAINSGLTLLELRDATLACAEEEDAREIVLRIPRSSRLESRLTEEAQNGDFVTVAVTAQPAADMSGAASDRSDHDVSSTQDLDTQSRAIARADRPNDPSLPGPR